MVKDREKLFNQAVREGWSRRKYEQAVALRYDARGWREKGERFSPSTVFRMVRDYEKDWRDTAPDKDVEAWVSPSAKKSHHQSDLSHDRLLRQKREYNSRPEVIRKRAEYRKKNRAKIAEAERKRRDFNRRQGLKN